MNTKLLDRLIKNTKIKGADTMNDSAFFLPPEEVSTPVYALNIALSGSLYGGYDYGVYGWAGESKSFKTMFGLIMMKCYLDKYPNAVAIFYDTEFGASLEYFKNVGIDVKRVVHIPIMNLEELKFDMVGQLDALEHGDKVFFFIDSIGNIASKKELEDAKEGKGTQDMSRAKQLKSFWRMVTPYIKTKKLPCWAIHHIYMEQGSMYPKAVVSGGTGGIYSSDGIYMVTKSQNKDGKDLLGYNFTIVINKSRKVIEQSKIPITVNFGDSINPYTGLFDLAMESGHIIAPKQGYYTRVIVDKTTGEVKPDKNWRRADAETSKEFWNPVLNESDFPEWVKTNFQLANSQLFNDEDEFAKIVGDDDVE